jgi:hypothetical protein
MAKKDEEKKLTHDQVEELLPPAPPEPDPEPEESDEESGEEQDLPYEVLSYAGMELLRCKQCAWDTTKGVAVILAHIQSKHGPPPPPETTILVADKSGREKQ